MKMPNFVKKENVKMLPEVTLKRIPIDNIRMAAYQRELKPAKVKQIIKTFLPDIADYPLISFRRGEFWCVDGQHILRALQGMGYKDVTCRLLSDLTYEEECLRFVILNTGRTRLNANQIFHGRVEEKDANAVVLVDMFKKYGYTYNKNGSGRNENCIGTVNSFVDIQEKYGIDMVERVLKILRKTWFGEKDSLLASIVNGLKTFLNEYSNCDDEVLIKALEKVSPSDIESDAVSYKKGNKIRPARAGSTCYHVAKIIAQQYEEEIARPRKRKARVS